MVRETSLFHFFRQRLGKRSCEFVAAPRRALFFSLLRDLCRVDLQANGSFDSYSSKKSTVTLVRALFHFLGTSLQCSRQSSTSRNTHSRRSRKSEDGTLNTRTLIAHLKTTSIIEYFPRNRKLLINIDADAAKKMRIKWIAPWQLEIELGPNQNFSKLHFPVPPKRWNLCC